MRALAFVVPALALILPSGCQSKSGTKQGAGSGSTAGSANAGSGSTATGSKLALPKGDLTPPRKTTTPLGESVIEKLAALEYPGFEKTIRIRKESSIDLRHRTVERPHLSVDILAAACFDCPPMDLDQWKAKESAIRPTLLLPELVHHPDTVFELGKTELNGAPLIYAYALGATVDQDEQGQPAAAYANSYTLFYNDGVNQIRVIAKYSDEGRPPEQMTELAPRKDLEKIAKAFLDAYTHTW